MTDDNSIGIADHPTTGKRCRIYWEGEELKYTPLNEKDTNDSKRTKPGTFPQTPKTSNKKGTGTSSPASKPTQGDAIDVSSAKAVLKWLQDHMRNTSSLCNRQHLLTSTQMNYSLQNRQRAMEESEELLAQMFESSVQGRRERHSYVIPVCSAMSGIGKSRLLDEWVNKFNTADYKPKGVSNKFPPTSRRLAFVMSYGNGHTATKYERSIGSAAAFAWRLLYQSFLDSNTDLGWELFWLKLPKNADDLLLQVALEVIRMGMQAAISETARAEENGDEYYALFVGIDEYQMVPQNDADQGYTHVLTPLLNALVSHMTNSTNVVILPMFAGTDWEKLSVAASASSGGLAGSTAVTNRLAMPLLSPKEMREAVLGRGEGTEKLLEQELFCRHLFFLGGVPRPCTLYAEKCLEWSNQNPKPEVGATEKRLNQFFNSNFSRFFNSIYRKVPEDKTIEGNGRKEASSKLSLRELIRLAAYSVRGLQIEESTKPFEGLDNAHLSFSLLRDVSVCVIDEEDEMLHLPYCFFYHLSSIEESDYQSFSDPEKAFMDVLRYLKTNVDHNVFNHSNAPWQQWEIFGACFIALRINSILILEDTTEKLLSEVYIGARHTLKELDLKVRLRPTRVVRAHSGYSSEMPVSIRLCNEGNDIDWVSSDVVVLNGDNSKGIDIFYTLERADCPSEYILITDQRKRVHAALDVNRSIQKASMSPGPVQIQAGIKHCVPTLFSMFTCDNTKLPPNSIAVTFNDHEVFHGSLHQHPAASSCIRVNLDGVTALSGLFSENRYAGGHKLMEERDNRTISSFDELKERLGGYAHFLWEDAETQCIF